MPGNEYINNRLTEIKTAVYGKDVRKPIYDAISYIYENMFHGTKLELIDSIVNDNILDARTSAFYYEGMVHQKNLRLSSDGWLTFS